MEVPKRSRWYKQPASPETETLLIELPKSIGLYVTQEQFAALAVANRDLRLERTEQGELIVNPILLG